MRVTLKDGSFHEVRTRIAFLSIFLDRILDSAVVIMLEKKEMRMKRRQKRRQQML